MRLQQWAKLQEAMRVMKCALNGVDDVKDEVTDSEIKDLLESSLASVSEGIDILDNVLEI